LAMEKKFGIAVAGTHGKTTTTAMVTTILKEAGENPSFVIGGEVKELGGNSGIGSSDFLVAEACEFGGNFLHLKPKVAIVTNIEEDHLDYYRDLKEIKKAFVKFISLLPADGFLVISEDAQETLASKEDLVVEAKKELRPKAKVFTYGLKEGNDYQATGISLQKNSTSFDILYRKEFSAALSLKIPGEHNILNSLAAFAIGHQLGIKKNLIKNALDNFQGVGRRFEIKGEISRVTVIDDYGHHPTEIKATLSAVRQRYPVSRLIAVFQPHQYSRTRFFLDDFAKAFKKANLIIVPDIYFVRDSAKEKRLVNSKSLVEKIKKNRGDALYLPDFTAIVNYLLKIVRSGDVILTIGAGPVYQIADELIKKLKNR